MANFTIGNRVMILGVAVVAAIVIVAVVALDADEVALRLIDAMIGSEPTLTEELAQ